MNIKPPNSFNPVRPEHFAELNAAIFSPEPSLRSRFNVPVWRTVGDHRVTIVHCLDDDAYSAWTIDNRLIGVDIDLSDGSVFAETYYYNHKDNRIVRYRAKPIHDLIERVVITDGTPSLPNEITGDTKLQYWHTINDATRGGLASAIDPKRPETAQYKALSGSAFIVKYLESSS